MKKITPNKFEKGIYIKFRGEPFKIMEIKFHNPGRGSAFYQTKLKNIKTFNILSHTFKPGEIVEVVELDVIKALFLYKQDKEFIFMDQNSFEQIILDGNTIGNFAKFLKESESYQILIFNQKPIGINIPKKVKLLVTEAEEAVAGNTAISAKKVVTLESGTKLTVPLFIKKNDHVSVNPETEEYVERVNH